jgi:hypothetical protein
MFRNVREKYEIFKPPISVQSLRDFYRPREALSDELLSLQSAWIEPRAKRSKCGGIRRAVSRGGGRPKGSAVCGGVFRTDP